jgi:hypothetical protein
MTTKFDSVKYAQITLAILDACNLSGLVATFYQMTHDMRESGMDTNQCNTHPYSILFAEKFRELTGADGMTEFRKAYEYTENEAKKAKRG